MEKMKLQRRFRAFVGKGISHAALKLLKNKRVEGAEAAEKMRKYSTQKGRNGSEIRQKQALIGNFVEKYPDECGLDRICAFSPNLP